MIFHNGSSVDQLNDYVIGIPRTESIFYLGVIFYSKLLFKEHGIIERAVQTLGFIHIHIYIYIIQLESARRQILRYLSC